MIVDESATTGYNRKAGTSKTAGRYSPDASDSQEKTSNSILLRYQF